jgi:hypothetical protein
MHMAQDTDQWLCSCEHSEEPSGSIKGRKFLDQMSDYHLFKKGSAPLNQSVSCNYDLQIDDTDNIQF